MTEYTKFGLHPSVVWELWSGNSIQRIRFLKHLAHAGIVKTKEEGGVVRGFAVWESQIPAPRGHRTPVELPRQGETS